MERTYIGDSVYVSIENNMVKLETDNGLGPSNTIYLEPEVYDRFTDFMEKVVAKTWGGINV